MPYKLNTWNHALLKAKLDLSFLNLVHNPTYGSPIGNPPPLMHTFLPPNLPLANFHAAIIDQDLVDRVVVGPISGPFSLEDAHIIFGTISVHPECILLKRCLGMVNCE